MLCAGQVYESTLTVKGQTGAPSSVTLAITKPDGTLVSPAPALGAGSQVGADWVITYDYMLPTAGRFVFTWTTQGPGTAPPPDVVNVRDFISIVGLGEMKTHLNKTSTADDDELAAFMMAATELIESKVGTCARRVITSEFITGRAQPVIRLRHGPLPSADAVTSVVSVYPGGPSWATADLVAAPAAATVRTVNLAGFWYGPWRVTYTAGRPVIPERLIQACKEQVRHMWDTQRGAAAPSVLQGEEIYTPGGGGSAFTVPRRVLELLDADTVPGFA